MLQLEFTASAIRSFKNPNIPGQVTHQCLLACSSINAVIPNDPNAREATGLNQKVYKQVIESLKSNDGNFHLKNKGIVMVASSAGIKKKRNQPNGHVVDGKLCLTFEDGDGILDGGHTYEIIREAVKSKSKLDKQYVLVTIHTGIPEHSGYLVQMAQGLNTSVQVKDSSLLNLGGYFKWLEESLGDYSSFVAFTESDAEISDSPTIEVRDVLSALECFNIDLYDAESDIHPIRSATASGTILARYSKEVGAKGATSFDKFGEIDKDVMVLLDTIRFEFKQAYNQNPGTKGALLSILNTKSKADLLFIDQMDCTGTLWRTAALPILASFRCFIVEEDGKFVWRNGFDEVLDAWETHGKVLAKRIVDSGYRSPDALAKDLACWRTCFDWMLRVASK